MKREEVKEILKSKNWELLNRKIEKKYGDGYRLYLISQPGENLGTDLNKTVYILKPNMEIEIQYDEYGGYIDNGYIKKQRIEKCLIIDFEEFLEILK